MCFYGVEVISVLCYRVEKTVHVFTREMYFEVTQCCLGIVIMKATGGLS